MHILFIAALFAISKLWKQPIFATNDEWVKKIWHLYTMEFYLATRRMKYCHFQVNA
jgi:hypothetical protein